MPRTPRSNDISSLLHPLTVVGDGELSEAEKLMLVASLRGQNESTDKVIDQYLVRDGSRLRAGLAVAQSHQDKLRSHLEKLAGPPHHPAVLLGRHATEKGVFAMVCHGSSRRVVAFSDEVDPEQIAVGDEVLLGNDLNVVVQKSPYSPQRGGEMASFSRYTDDGRLLVKWRDEEVVVDAAGPLAGVKLRNGDLLRWERGLWLAFEKIERAGGEHLFLEETPTETFDDIGGLDGPIAELKRLVQIHLEHPELVGRYRLRRKRAVLLHGPPGGGKTLLARGFSNFLSSIHPSRKARFINVKPGSLHSAWYSETERNYREMFRVAREASLENPDIPVVLFLDEIDAIGSARSDSMSRIDDRILPALMTELNGLTDRGNVLVIAATNRVDALDPALLRPGRLGDLVIEIPRPRRDAARAIFEKHLHPAVPVDVEGCEDSAAAARSALIDSALSAIYAPNAGSEFATLVMRDGKRRVVTGADLISGAGIASICGAATERACLRQIETGAAGLRRSDLLSALDDEFQRAAGVLTPLNCRKHLSGIPSDVDVATIEPRRRAVSRVHRYLRIA